MIAKILILTALLLLSLISDIKTKKIPNKITASFAGAGLILNCILQGMHGLLFSFAGWALPVTILFPLLLLRMLGAGDIKLFASIGALMGYSFVAYTVLYSFVFGGIISVIVLLTRRNCIKRFRYFMEYIKSCLLTQSFQEYSDVEDKANGGRFRFAYAVVPGAIIQLILACCPVKLF